MGVIVVFSIPSVQTWAAAKVTDRLNGDFGTDIHIGRLGLNWRAEIDMREVYIADHHRDTLIYSKELQTNIRSLRKIINGKLHLDKIQLERARFYLKTYKGEETDNLTVFTDKFATDKEPSGEPFFLSGRSIKLSDSRIKIINENLEKPEIFVFDKVNLQGRKFEINGPNIGAEVDHLDFAIKDGMTVENMKAKFALSATSMIFENLILQTRAGTDLKGDLTFDYSKTGSMGNFENDVVITANIRESLIASEDLNTFYNEFGPNQKIFITSDISGILNDFKAEKSLLKIGTTEFTGDLYFKDIITDNQPISIVAKNHNFYTNYYDLRRLMPDLWGNSLPDELKELKNFRLIGNSSFIGDEVKTAGTLSSDIGQAQVDITMGNFQNVDYAYYRGTVSTTNLDLRKITKTSALGRVTGQVKVNGRGLNQRTLNTEISGAISSLSFEGYNYKNIQVSGKLKHPLFDGHLSINDPNLKLDFTGLIDASKEKNKLDFHADVEYSDLNKLNLVTRDSIAVFTGTVVVDMEGNTIDDVEGTINFNRTFYQSERDFYYFDDFRITSSFEEKVRTIAINSPDIMNGKITGEFLIEDVPNLFQNGVASIYANYIPVKVTENQYINYEFEVYNKIVDVFIPQLKFGDNTRFRGSVYSDQSKFVFDFRSPEILLFGNYIGKLRINMDNDNPLFNTYISADSIYTGVYEFKNLDVINKTLNDTMYVRAEVRGGKQKEDLYDLSLYHTINENGKSVIGAKRSSITFKGNEWHLNENNNKRNKVVFDDNFAELHIDSLILNHKNERIELAGMLRDSTYKDIKMNFVNVNLDHITPTIDSLKLAGNVNGKLDFLQKNKAFYPNSTITIDDLFINDIALGDLDLDISGNENLTQYTINTSLIHEGRKSINAEGRIDVAKSNPRIQLDLDFDRFNIAAFSPFGEDIISDIRGYLSGNAIVSGSYKSPDLRGLLRLESGGFKVPYLNTDFEIEDKTDIHVTKNRFEVANATITDTKYGTTASLNGYGGHNNFQDWELNLKINAPNRFLVLDTPEEEEALYYGTAFMSGLVSIEGPVDQLVIHADATTESGTSFKIPISEMETISDDSFVHFLSPEEKRARIEGETTLATEIKKLSLEFDLNINNNAEVEVVVDQVNNSKLKGRGSGTLLLRIDTAGKFLMYGDFVVFSGEFDFRYGGIIQRNIAVVPGGSIIWNGAPERANLDLKAVYNTEANPSVLLDNPTVNRKIPVEVYVGLNGELEQPELNFEIEFPRVSSTLNSELQFKLQTEEQRQNQALFLLASNSFVDDNFGGTNAFAGTVADRMSGLVNSLFADQDGKFKVGLDYSVGSNAPDQETADRFGVTLSTQISERILINGKVGVPVGGATETSVAGDIEVQWLMNEDGSLRMKFFNRQADLQFIGEDQIFEQGAGISYSVSFNTFQELMRKLFNRKAERERHFIPVVPDDSSFPMDYNYNSSGTLPENDVPLEPKKKDETRRPDRSVED